MNTVCPHCQKQLEMSDDLQGKQVACPACQQEFTVMRSLAPSDSPPPVPTPGVPSAWQPSFYGTSQSPALNLTPPKWLLLIGLVLVIFSRGCDSIRSRGVTRAYAKVGQIRQQIEKEGGRLRPYEDFRNRDDELDSSKIRKLREKEDELEEKANNSGIQNMMWGYWTEWIFVIGSILLMIGLILVGFTGIGAERIICLAMIAIIMFSIYIGGIAWLSSVVNTVAGVARSVDRMF